MSIAALFLVLAPCAGSPTVPSLLQTEARRTAEQILERGDYQRELPARSDASSLSFDGTGDGSGDGGGAGGGGPDERGARRPREEDAAGGRAGRPGPRQSNGRLNLNLPAGVVRAVGWTLLALLVVLLVVWLVRAYGGGDLRFRERDEREEERVPAATFDDLPLTEAERLAREGRFGEAIRALLRLTFQALRNREGVRLEPWLTSREVLGAARLPDDQRASLGRLVAAVESSLFARHEPGLDEFEACTKEYRALLPKDAEAARG